ncbi:MAG: hypothetical protein K0S68_720, partial [Candidatus Saccharibacteria bacterium]|nr:hypothetical protein [Candidatus Saccharibacteria bacterium]
KGAEKSTLLMEIEGEKKSHMMTTSAGQESYNVITIDGTTYTKDLRDGKWWEYKPQSTPTSDGFKESFDFKDEEKDKPETEKTKYTKIGKEACGSLTCFKYQVVEPGITGTSYIWFDDRDYQLRRMQTTEDGEVNDMTFSYTKPNITKPSPIKQGNPGEMNNFAPEI